MANQENARPEKTQPRWMLHAVIAGYALIMVSLFWTIFTQQKDISAGRERAAAYQKQLEQLEAEGGALRSRIEFSMTDEYVEQQARDKLNLVKENEIRFIPE